MTYIKNNKGELKRPLPIYGEVITITYKNNEVIVDSPLITENSIYNKKLW